MLHWMFKNESDHFSMRISQKFEYSFYHKNNFAAQSKKNKELLLCFFHIKVKFNLLKSLALISCVCACTSSPGSYFFQTLSGFLEGDIWREGGKGGREIKNIDNVFELLQISFFLQ